MNEGYVLVPHPRNLNQLSKVLLKKEALAYVVDEFGSGRLYNNLEINLYLTRYLDKKLDNYPEMRKADDLVFDIFQIIKDSIRLNSNEYNDEMNKGFRYSIESNNYQVQKNMNPVKAMLD